MWLTCFRQIIQDYRLSTYGSHFAKVMKSDANFEFTTIEEAKSVFEYGLYSFTSSSPACPSCDTEPSTESLQDHVDYFTTLMTKFSISMRIFLDMRGQNFTPREEISVAALQLHMLNSYISFYTECVPQACRPHGKTLLPEMKKMVSLCEEIIPFVSDGTESVHQRTSFCLDIGYVIPLYTVASRCQDITTRRRAIALLRSAPRQEGLWSSPVVARAAERMLEIEETVGEQLVPCAPVTTMSMLPSPSTVLQLDSTGVRLQYIKPGQDIAVPVSVVEEVVTW